MVKLSHTQTQRLQQIILVPRLDPLKLTRSATAVTSMSLVVAPQAADFTERPVHLDSLQLHKMLRMRPHSGALNHSGCCQTYRTFLVHPKRP